MNKTYQILFIDSPEYFIVKYARMIFESNMVRFVCFTCEDQQNAIYKEDMWFPVNRIHRIKTITNP